MSRIIVKNLPKYATEDRLKEFFSEKGEVTDAKLMRTREGKNRQFAFIGYRTEKEAEEAIKYFNKSFMDTSRIICEVAWKVGAMDIPRPWSQYSKEKQEIKPEKSSKILSGKTKPDKKSSNLSNENDDAKLKEFRQVMQPRSKSKMWANDLVVPTHDQSGKGNKEHGTLKKDLKQLNREENSGREVEMPDENQVLGGDDEDSDTDYFKSRVTKEWSDSESDGDGENEFNLDPSEGNLDKKDFNEEDIDESDFEESNVNPGNVSSNSEDTNEVLQSGRLFVRNLPYAATEDELAELFSKFGNISEVHLVIDKETKRSKGFAYVHYRAPEDALRALEELDHSIFQGRLLHIMPAKAKDLSSNQGNLFTEGKTKTLKERRVEEKKASEADGNTQAWNSLFMRADTIVENIARRFGISKSDFLDREADDLAVRIALGETQIIAETKKALTNAGVNVASLEELATRTTEGVKRSNHVLLVKNLPYSSTESELSKMFGKFGSIDKIILPPTRTLALVIFLEPADARAACRGLAYKRYKDAPLYLEWAPGNILSQDLDIDKSNMIVGEQEAKKVSLEHQIKEISQDELDPDRVESRSLFVKSLNFKTADETLRKHFSENMKEGRVLSVKIKKHLKNGKNVSKGFGFVEFDSVETATNVCRDLQGTVLDGHALILELCHAKKDEKVLKKSGNDQSSTKIIVRNVAFEATEKDLRQLFSPFGQIKTLRLPMRFGKHRGFAFIKFVTKQEAQNALNALSSTHLYGRHLVLERAKEGETLEELRARTAAQFANDEEGFQNPTKISKKRKITALAD
ncbi:multiple RNA-binding domain-containing protein 1-like [Chenopodium quinoa]|uniref:multiple RNA-binding domain-containing protein 1-like n=1 Tax=Chenopodium quinoa TaxID=63459 RepID=UPI000B76C765|nr:multiple RNA-binding domain-containing protein 1-like [Chenopodium quinoa]